MLGYGQIRGPKFGLGEVSRLLTEAAEHAITDGSERISLEHLEQAVCEQG